MADSSAYALGYSELEHQRLMRQDERWRSSTELLFREAGVAEGQRVLDLGSGIGDVAMTVARIVGRYGEVVGVELDGPSAMRARERTAAAGFTNITILESDILEVNYKQPFDAVVGRFVLQFLPDPTRALQHVLGLLRSGGSVAFQEVAWSPALAANAHLPLWSACGRVTRESIRRTGANTDSGLALHKIFVEAGLPRPTIRAEMKLGTSRELVLWAHDLLMSIRARAHPDAADPALEVLGDLATLGDRLMAEVRDTRCAVASITAVGAWAQLPAKIAD